VSKVETSWRPVLAHGVRYRWDALRAQHQLLFPEGVLVLNASAAAIVELCDGRTVGEICEELCMAHPDVEPGEDVKEFLDRLVRRQLLRNDDAQ
jgi:pyrroloquinoline quinone biosynthesis protein D